MLAISDAVIPAITGFFFDRIIEHAEAESRARTASTAASSNGRADENFWNYDASSDQIERHFGCVVLVRPQHANSVIDSDVVAQLSAADPQWRDRLNGAMPGLDLAAGEVPELIAEFRVVPVTAQQAETELEEELGFRLRMVTLAYAATGARRTSNANAKDLTFALRLEGLAPDESGELAISPVYAHDFILQDVPLGTFVRTPDDPSIADSDEVPAFFGGQIGPIAARPNPRFTYNDANFVTLVPLTASIAVTEFEEGGDLARAVLDAVAENEAAIRAPIDARLRRAIVDLLTETEPREGQDADSGEAPAED